MATFKKTLVQMKCNCGKSQTIYELSLSINKTHLNFFSEKGFIEGKSYTVAGILYVENNNIIIIGPFGSNRLQIKCKIDNCDNSFSELENYLSSLS